MPDFFSSHPDSDKHIEREKLIAEKASKKGSGETNSFTRKNFEVQFKDEIKEKIFEQYFKDKNLDYVLKKSFSDKVIAITIGWFIFVAILSVIHIQAIFNIYRFSNSLMMVIYSTTTINVIGLMITILHYLFPSNKKN